MYCARCGTPAEDGTHFCQNCGAPLQEPGAVTRRPPTRQPMQDLAPVGAMPAPRSKKPVDPYKEQIAQLKLDLKQLKLHLKQITTGMSTTRSQYYQTAAFVPHGLLRRGYKMLEDARLLGPQQQKQALQQQIMQLEQELISLQQQQAYWRSQQ